MTEPALYRELERRSFASWPALTQIDHQGWVVRLGDGYTKRANSVTALAYAGEDVDASIAWCEALYRQRRLTPIFRLSPHAAPADLDARLAARGYGVLDPSQVLCLDLFRWRGRQTWDSALDSPLEAWIVAFGQLSGANRQRLAQHAALLGRIASPRLLALGRDRQGQAIGCAVAVLDGAYLGLYDLLIDPMRRREGHGHALVQAALAWGQARGARHAYLQVMEDNLPARQLYDALGFRLVYPYWYRVAPDAA